MKITHYTVSYKIKKCFGSTLPHTRSVACTGGGEQRFTGRPGGPPQRQQQYRPQHQQISMEGVASMEQDTENHDEGVIMVSVHKLFMVLLYNTNFFILLL